MRGVVVAAALLVACRGDHPPASRSTYKDAGLARPASPVSAVPALPRSDDGSAELGALDKQIEIAAGDDARLVPLLLERASIRGRLEDYERALTLSAALVKKLPEDVDARLLRVKTLVAVHRFGAARDVLDKLAGSAFPGQLVEQRIAIDDATGRSEQALAARAQLADEAPNPQTITLYAGALARAGRFDEALAQMQKALPGTNRINTPRGTSWLYFQWGLIYEAKGDIALARDFYRAAFARMPGSLETVEHLAGALAATGDPAAASTLANAALADNRHPALLALAGKTDEAAAEWERYVKALPEAFSDHAARFYLAAGKNPMRALELARANLANRDTLAARALVVEAALAAGDPEGACKVVDPLLTAGTKADRFTAWKALGACGRKADADKLGNDLGI